LLRQKESQFPSFTSPLFGTRAFPKAILQKPDPYWSEVPFDKKKLQDGVEAAASIASDYVDMSVLFFSTKRILHKKAVYRTKITRKLKAALGLVITRGAETQEIDGQLKIVFKDNCEEEREWVLKSTFVHRGGSCLNGAVQIGHMYFSPLFQYTGCPIRLSSQTYDQP
jgi:hypothetical protein